MKKLIGASLLIISIIFIAIWITVGVRANYEWNSNYYSYWSLGVKASTIEQKSQYIDRFVTALQTAGLQGSNDALFFPTADNSFDSNFQALQSLQGRLHEIQKMDESSFQYQTAIQQITSQEQDDAGDMLNVLSGTWWKVHHYFLWNPWITFLGVVILIILILISMYCFFSNDY